MNQGEDRIDAYIRDRVPLDHPLLARLLAREAIEEGVAPSVGPHAGRFLGVVVRLIDARRVLELGTCLGYSTVCLALALRETGGRLTSIEVDARMAEETRRSLRTAGLTDLVDVIEGDAAAVLPTLDPPFDLILQDSDKKLYPVLLDRCVDLLRPGGLLVADDALFPPMGVREGLSAPVDAYNRRVIADKRLYSAILPIGDGLAVSVRRGS